MKADDNTMNSVELAIFNQVQALLEQEPLYQALRPIVVKCNGAFASLTLSYPDGCDSQRFDRLLSDAVRPLGVTKITYRRASNLTVETEKPKESAAAVPGPSADPFADFSFSGGSR